jgi:hypothetical protein
MPSITLNEKLLLFHDKLMALIPRDLRLNYIVEDLDDIITDVSGTRYRSCPFCRSMLFEKEDHTWVCNSTMHHGGQVLVFIEGSNPCNHIDSGGPFCRWHGYCLWQVHGPLGYPIRCKYGRIDDQSPRPK